MRREIKFRAWVKKRKVMESVYWFDFNNSQLSTRNEGCLNSNDYEIMQYTGLKAKDGKKIYEGDIVKWRGDFIGNVYFANAEFRVLTKDTNYFLSGISNDREIIGNIYENEELLGEKNETLLDNDKIVDKAGQELEKKCGGNKNERIHAVEGRN